jgi:phosphatidylethanolamine-binding protein (PEBP) family uncharacterized protein
MYPGCGRREGSGHSDPRQHDCHRHRKLQPHAHLTLDQQHDLSFELGGNRSLALILVAFYFFASLASSAWWHRVVSICQRIPIGFRKPPVQSIRTHRRREPSARVHPTDNHPHRRYVFTICAWNVEKLDVPADSGGAPVPSTAQDHLIGKRVLVGHYGR